MFPAVTQPDAEIATPRLILRPPTRADIPDMVSELNDFSVTRMLARVPFPYGRRDAEAFLDSSERDGNGLTLVITASGRLVGGIGLARIDDTCELGYWLGRAHWGMGFATEAVRAFVRYTFATYAIERMTSGVFIDNADSLRVQDKVGFRIVGRRFVDCVARGIKVEHIDTVLTRARFLEASR